MYVVGKPRFFLRLEGVVLLIASLVLFSSTHQHWWWVPVLLFLPDLVMVGYVRSTATGAMLYNLGHSYLLPVLIALSAWRSDRPLLLAIGLIWLAHIGMDRALGYGLKYDDNFKHTHLGSLYKQHS